MNRGFAAPFAILVGVVAVATIIVLFMLLGKNSNQGQNDLEVTSNDGKIKMTIPKDALPKEVEVSTVGVKKVSTQNDTSVFVYQLTPDGLTLSQPATVTATFEGMGQSIPIVSHIAGKSFVPVDNVEIRMGEEANKTKISAKLDHFSSFAVLFGIFEGEISGIDEIARVGDSFPVRVAAKHTGKTLSLTLENGTKTTEEVKPPWTLEGELNVDQVRDGVRPTNVPNRPPLTQLKKLGSISAEETFGCQSETPSARIIFTGKVKGEVEILFEPNPQNKEKNYDNFKIVEPFEDKLYVYSGFFECIALPSPSPKTSSSVKTGTSTNTGSASKDSINMDVLIIGGKNFPALQFRTAGSDKCDAPHYHSDFEVSSVDLATHLNDPEPGGCGFGKVSEVVKKTVVVSQEQAQVWK